MGCPAPGADCNGPSCIRHERTNDLPVVTLGLILLTASLVAIFTRQVKLPYSVGLVVGGGVLALSRGDRTCR
jgi:hypothetical protein